MLWSPLSWQLPETKRCIYPSGTVPTEPMANDHHRRNACSGSCGARAHIRQLYEVSCPSPRIRQFTRGLADSCWCSVAFCLELKRLLMRMTFCKISRTLLVAIDSPMPPCIAERQRATQNFLRNASIRYSTHAPSAINNREFGAYRPHRRGNGFRTKTKLRENHFQREGT